MLEALEKISTDGKYMFLAYDHGFEHGPEDLPGKSINPEYVLEIAAKGRFSAIILQKGLALHYYKDSKYAQQIPLIVKINGKAKIRQGEPLSSQNCSVKFAKEVLGAVAVGYTIYLGSENDPWMFSEFGRVVEEARAFKMGAIAWVYPRGKAVLNEQSPEITAYAARVGAELGADMVKIRYSGSTEAFKKAVEAAGKTRVVLSGGAKTDRPEEFENVARSVMESGASGIAVGRNVWQSENPMVVAEGLRRVIFGNLG